MSIFTDGSSALQSETPRIGASPALSTRVEWLRTAAEVAPLEPEWREFEASVRNRTALSAFDYNATWYGRYAGLEGEALVGVARRGSELVGVAPLVIRRRRVGRVPLTCVEFAAHEAYAGEFLVEDDHPETSALFLDSLVRSVPFDLVCLNEIDLGSERFGALRDTAARHRLGVEVTDHPNAVVDLTSGYDQYFRGRSAHFRASVRRHGRLIEAAGQPVIGGVCLARGVEGLEDAIERMIAINERSYKLNGERLADCHRGFLAEIARRFGPRGMLCLPILTIGDRDAAFVVGMVERNCFYDVTLAYDEAFAKLSPGMHLIQQMLRELASAGIHTVVSHGAHEYKKHWATTFVPSPRVFLFAPGWRSAATRFLRFQMAAAWRRFGYEDA